jgi:hypothetical protein
LGTFWGLLQTIGTVGQVISGLEVGTQDFINVVTHLKQGLEEPLKGMGTAFSSSLFGLGGSLVLGFVDIQAGHAQNRFFNEMEEWLSGVTRLVDTDETLDAANNVSAAALKEIGANLGELIHQTQKNNQVMMLLVNQQKPSSGADPAVKK